MVKFKDRGELVSGLKAAVLDAPPNGEPIEERLDKMDDASRAVALQRRALDESEAREILSDALADVGEEFLMSEEVFERLIFEV